MPYRNIFHMLAAYQHSLYLVRGPLLSCMFATPAKNVQILDIKERARQQSSIWPEERGLFTVQHRQLNLVT